MKKRYNYKSKKIADFICIRPFDDPKYAIDIVVKWAKRNPDKNFHLYGRGKYFDHNFVPRNIKIFNTYIPQDNLPELIDMYHACLMPTRLDSQGVMACEMATYGVPLITSDIPIMHEMLDDFKNVFFLDNEKDIDLNSPYLKPGEAKCPMEKFSPNQTVQKEIDFFRAKLDNLLKNNLSIAKIILILYCHFFL